MDNSIEQSTSVTSDANGDNRTEVGTIDNDNIYPNFSTETFHIITASSQPDLERSISS